MRAREQVTVELSSLLACAYLRLSVVQAKKARKYAVFRTESRQILLDVPAQIRPDVGREDANSRARSWTT